MCWSRVGTEVYRTVAIQKQGCISLDTFPLGLGGVGAQPRVALLQNRLAFPLAGNRTLYVTNMWPESLVTSAEGECWSLLLITGELTYLIAVVNVVNLPQLRWSFKLRSVARSVRFRSSLESGIWEPAQDFFYFLSRKVQSGSGIANGDLTWFWMSPYLTHQFQVLEFLLISWWVYLAVWLWRIQKMCSVVPCLK